jgi:hypothetical protein
MLAIPKLVYECRIEQPRCPSCREFLDISAVQPRMDQPLFCGHCGSRTTTSAPPAWLAAKRPDVLQVFCAKREGEDDAEQPAPEALKPVMMACLHCGAALPINPESPRITQCQYCQTDHYVPDDIWRRMHPLKKRMPWYVAYAEIEVVAHCWATARQMRKMMKIRQVARRAAGLGSWRAPCITTTGPRVAPRQRAAATTNSDPVSDLPPPKAP